MYARDDEPWHNSHWNNDGPDPDDSAAPTPAATTLSQASLPTSTVSTTSSVQTTGRTSPTLLTIGRASTSATEAGVTNVADGSANLTANKGFSGRSMSDGAIAAAVVVPLLVLGLLAAVLFMLRRRKTKPVVPDMAEQPMSAHEHYAPVPPPIAGYYTGLDPDHVSASDEPPPPYGNKAAAVPLIAVPADRSETESSLSWRTADAGFLAPEVERQSISSTGYSDNASVHSARAARLSIGGANMISNLRTPSRDPFDDPESPVSSVDGDDSRMLQGPISRAVSPVNSSR